MDEAQSERRRRRRGGTTRVALTAVAALALLVAIAGSAAHFASVARPTWLGVVAFAPYLMLGAPIALVLAAIARQWVGVAVSSLVLALCVSTQARLYIASPPPSHARAITVMTANLRLGGANAAAVVAAARRHHADLLMVQELTEPERQRLIAAGLATALPYSVAEPRRGAAGTGLWSRYPLVDATHVTGFSFAMVKALVQVPGFARMPIAVSLHLSGPVPYPAPWQHDIAQLRSTLLAIPSASAVIAAGDFNATPDTAQFRALLVDGYRDAADQAGAGMTRTFPANRWYPPLIAIDHVLTRHAVGLSAITVHIPGSDHRALVARIAAELSADG